MISQSSNLLNNQDKDTVVSNESTNRFKMNLANVVITGASIGLPGSNRKVFDDNNFSEIINGTNFIDNISSTEQKKILDKNIKKVIRDKEGNQTIEHITKSSQIHKLAGLKGFIDLEKEYNIPHAIISTLDKTYELAIAAGLEALKDASIPLVPKNINSKESKDWELPKMYQQSTGIIFASSFPVLDAISQEITAYLEHKLREKFVEEIKELQSKLQLEDLERQNKIFNDFLTTKKNEIPDYQFDRKILFKLLVMGNAQLAQIIKAKGPNTTLNAACASTTQAVTLAEDWIKLGRCERVIVVGADDPTSENLLQWIGTGFLILGAASTKEKIEDAALPFDRRRNGMILGMGAVGLIVESEQSAKNRGRQPLCKILGTHMANSAYHGTALDINHVSAELEEFISRMEKFHHLSRQEMSQNLVYMSHETFTFANGGAAKAEINALNYVFKEDLSNIIISNTKGYTGHPMGVGIEDAISAYALRFNKIPPIANLKEKDPDLGDLKYASNNDKDFNYILRFAAGFGSQMVYLLFQKYDNKLNENRFEAWLKEMFDGQSPEISRDGFLKSYLS